MTGLGLAQPIVTLSEAQAFVRVETGEEEAILAGLIRSASALCEAFIGQVVMARDFTEEVAASACWQRLRLSPVRSISSVEADGVPLPAASYATDIDAGGDGWVRVSEPRAVSRVQVSGTRGSRHSSMTCPSRSGTACCGWWRISMRRATAPRASRRRR